MAVEREVAKKAQLVYIFSLNFIADRDIEMEKESTIISIPTSLYKRVEEAIKGTGIASVSDYVIRVLREKLSQEKPADEVFSKEDEEKIKERLKALGYLD